MYKWKSVCLYTIFTSGLHNNFLYSECLECINERWSHCLHSEYCLLCIFDILSHSLSYFKVFYVKWFLWFEMCDNHGLTSLDSFFCIREALFEYIQPLMLTTKGFSYSKKKRWIIFVLSILSAKWNRHSF